MPYIVGGIDPESLEKEYHFVEKHSEIKWAQEQLDWDGYDYRGYMFIDELPLSLAVAVIDMASFDLEHGEDETQTAAHLEKVFGKSGV